jgi:hypothetical protein
MPSSDRKTTARSAFLQERANPLGDIGRLAKHIDAPGVEAVRFPGRIGSEHAPHQLTRGSNRNGRGIVSDLSGQRVRGWQQLVGRVCPGDQAAAQRLPCIEDAAGRHPFQGLANADDSREEPAGGGFHDQAATGEHKAELRVIGGEPDVHRERHRDTDPDRRPVDGSDHRLE